MRREILSYVVILITLILANSCMCDICHVDNIRVNKRRVTIELDVALDLTVLPMPSKSIASSESYYRRFIVDLYREDNLSKPYTRRTLLYDDINIEGQSFRLPIELELQTLDYKLAIWSDYIRLDDSLDTISFYNTNTLSDIHCLSPYQANTPYRDSSYGMSDLKLSGYKGEVIGVSVNMQRSSSPIRVLATDYDKLVSLHGEQVANNCIVEVSYGFFIPTGYSVLEALPIRSTSGLSFSSKINDSLPVDGARQIASDFIFVGEQEAFAVLNITVRDSSGRAVNTIGGLKVPYRKGYITTVKGGFLASESSPDIGLDIEFDEDINIDLDNN